MTKARRRKYHVQILVVLTRLGPIRHLKVSRANGRGGIPWEDLQDLKNEALGEDVLAVEVYPPSHLVVDETNMRHLWEMPGGHVPSNLLNKRPW